MINVHVELRTPHGHSTVTDTHRVLVTRGHVQGGSCRTVATPLATAEHNQETSKYVWSACAGGLEASVAVLGYALDVLRIED